MYQRYRFFIFVILMILVTGCGKAEEGPGKKEIVVWAWDPAYTIAALEDAKEIYEAEHPDTVITIVEMAKSEVEQKLQTNLASGSSKGLPDVVIIENVNFAKYVGLYTEAFEPYDQVDFDVFSTPVASLTIDGQVYGLPFGLATAGLFYRLDYIEAAGLTEKDMENLTWDQYIEIGKVVKEKTGKAMLTYVPDYFELPKMMMQSAGTWYTDEKGAPNLQDNEVIKEAVKVTMAIEESGMAKEVVGWPDYLADINGGEAASIITGCWILPTIMAEPEQLGLWRVAPIPRLDGYGSVNYANLGGSSWYVMASGDNKEVAQDFVASTFGGSRDLYEGLLEEHGIVSMYKPAFDSEAYNRETEFFGGQKIYSILSDWSGQVPDIRLGEATYEIDSLLLSELGGIEDSSQIGDALQKAENQYRQMSGQ